MAYTVILLLTRKPHLTPSEFKSYFENQHLPLVKSLFGPLCPVPKRRFYLARTDDNTATNNSTNNVPPLYTPWLLKGDPASVDFDCITELEWPDEETFKLFQGKLKQRENMERVARDHEEFMGEERILMIGEVEGGLPAGWD
ncbi:hypothetical protein GRF29_112g201264 [Pseudopithomyces chartarum]|uniref:EthD domain-containing protein n=1 Tax=Pseudopithomyces chartarum TaxID=1892770 RepID=A0AAN6RDH0_9PLEO|nr:hypothetical protein GRF29_112g201264 [Pseudopithomyces chartarum]